MACISSKHDPNNILSNYISDNNEELSLTLLYKEYLMLNCYVSKCPINESNQSDELNLKELCIVVGYNKYIVTVIIGNKKPDVKHKSKKKLELDKIYEYTFEMISGRLCCKNFILFR